MGLPGGGGVLAAVLPGTPAIIVPRVPIVVGAVVAAAKGRPPELLHVGRLLSGFEHRALPELHAVGQVG